MKHILLVFAFTCVAVCAVQAQRVIQGQVFGGMNESAPVDSMRVSTTSGLVTYTNAKGAYAIRVNPQDTLHFSYQGRELIHYPASFITTTDKFNVYLNNPTFFDTTAYNQLAPVTVTQRSYKQDSLYNRYMFSDVYDYTKPKFNPFSPITSISNLFNKPYIHRQQRYRKFAENNEQFGYVDSRWTRSLVGKVTKIQDDSVLTEFMKEYEPSYAKMKDMNELELYQYISDSYKKFQLKYPMKK